MSVSEPCHDCVICPRLAEFRIDNRFDHAEWHNAPVPAFGSHTAALLIVGLAPGLRGANRTGRPFTGDFAGDLLYPTLLRFGFASGTYAASANDGLQLVHCRITNAVRCVPPKNRPTATEVNNCRNFLAREIAGMSGLKIVLALGVTAHDSLTRVLGVRGRKFRHGAFHAIDADLTLADCYHCSRYNTNTGRLTESMFHETFAAIRDRLRDTCSPT
jgi:uracil-DNA glycosylase family 4